MTTDRIKRIHQTTHQSDYHTAAGAVEQVDPTPTRPPVVACHQNSSPAAPDDAVVVLGYFGRRSRNLPARTLRRRYATVVLHPWMCIRESWDSSISFHRLDCARSSLSALCSTTTAATSMLLMQAAVELVANGQN
jgi:hypothetical protein